MSCLWTDETTRQKPGMCESTPQLAGLFFNVLAGLILLAIVFYIVVLGLHSAAALLSGLVTQ
jgi:hypothetical protein